MALELTTADLASFLGEDPRDLDDGRAALLLEGAGDLVAAEIGEVPEKAKAVVLTVAGRAYVNPTLATQEVAGPFSSTPAAGGLYLTRSERRTCRLLAGRRGGAYTVDPTPVDAYPAGRVWPWGP